MQAMAWRVALVVGVALGAGCDGGTDDDHGMAVTNAAYTATTYDKPPYNPKTGVWLAWDVELESKEDLADFASDNDCGGKEATDYCPAVDEAHGALEKAIGVKVCSPPRWERSEGGGVDVYCSFCCEVTSWVPSIYCSKNCTREGGGDGAPIIFTAY